MEVSLDVAVANRFISSLSKSLQALCHGCMDFDSGIEIDGYINVNIDCGSKVYYVLNEKVQKSANNSMTFVSNSFLAKKDQTKPTRDGACSPVQELQSLPPAGFQSYPYAPPQRPVHHTSPSQVLRGPHKRSWSGMQKDWRFHQKKHSRGRLSYQQHSSSTSSPANSSQIAQTYSSPNTSSPFNQTENSAETSSGGSEVKIKKEAFDNDDQSGNPDLASGVQNEETSGDQFDSANVKTDPDNFQQSEDSSGLNLNSNNMSTEDKDNFLQQSFSNQPSHDDESANEIGDNTQNQVSTDANDINVSSNLGKTDHINFSGEGTSSVSTYNDDGGGNDMARYPPHSSYGEQGDAPEFQDQFDVIEINDEDEDVQAMFGDNREYY